MKRETGCLAYMARVWVTSLMKMGRPARILAAALRVFLVLEADCSAPAGVGATEVRREGGVLVVGVTIEGLR